VQLLPSLKVTIEFVKQTEIIFFHVLLHQNARGMQHHHYC
jgi:hypothetical protein